MFGVATQNGVGLGLGNIPSLTSLPYNVQLNLAVQSLFANGEPGFWLDPSDLSTMYQNSAGTTPVTAVEQPVGLILDKSQGLVLGAELVPDGNFTSGAGWSAPIAGATISGGSLNFDGVTSFNAGDVVTQGVSSAIAVVGKWYQISYQINSNTTGNISVGFGGVAGTVRASAGSYFEIVQATSIGSVQVYIRSANGVRTGSIDNISVKQIAGTPYYQSTAGVRPVLSARVNLLTKTEDAANAVWTKLNISIAAGVTDPQGGSTAFTITCTSAGGYWFQSSVAPNGTTNVSSLWVRRRTGTGAIYLRSSASPGTDSPIAVTASWTRSSMTVSNNSSANSFVLLIATSGDEIDIWHPDCRPSDQATGLIPTYQRVNTSTDYDTAGFPLYLSSNGTQWMQCASQDYTGVNKMLVCAGVRKLSDAALAVVFELSPTIASNNGAVLLSAPNSAAANLNFSSKGTTQVDNVVTTYTSPNTTVLTGLGDISAPSNIVRVNGAQVGSVLSTQGTGNYGNYAGFLFARNGASSMLTGNIYGLVGRGSTVASNAAQISQTELWTNNKTKAYAPITATLNSIGIPGSLGFGVGIAPSLPAGMTAIDGYDNPLSDNYGNYQYSDGSVMCWVPAFFYKWGTGANGLALNAVDIQPFSAYATVADANTAGYALHRAFYDGGVQPGFFVDKYIVSNNGGIASSLRNGIVVTTAQRGSLSTAVNTSLTGAPANTLGGCIAAAKTRGASFFASSRFIFAALAMLSYAHAKASSTTTYCAWYHATNNFPKGNNNNALGDAQDAAILYVADGNGTYPGCGKTGSANLFARTTHNGMNSGVADLNGLVWEFTPGLTSDATNLYVLKTTARMKDVTGSNTLATDLFGATGIAALYDSLGTTYEALWATAANRTIYFGNAASQVFSAVTSGNAWNYAGLGAPLAAGIGGVNAFGNDGLYDYKPNEMAPFSGGDWDNSSIAGVWAFYLFSSRTSSGYNIGFRSACYL